VKLAELFPALAHRYVRRLEMLGHRDGVSVPRLRLLGVLHCEGPQIMSALGDRLGVTARNVTALVDALEADGLVRRTPHQTDRRATVVELTPSGMTAATTVLDRIVRKAADLFRSLTEADQRHLIRMTETLLNGLQSECDKQSGI
jgi:DNA-binding MarR family transcriptional regulator